jgi:hypothetical protein
MISTPALLDRAPHERHQPRERGAAGFTRQCGERSRTGIPAAIQYYTTAIEWGTLPVEFKFNSESGSQPPLRVSFLFFSTAVSRTDSEILPVGVHRYREWRDLLHRHLCF